MGIHDGHRQRLKDRFLSQGLSGFEDHNILELLLFYSIPRSDTNEIAHRLLNEFKTLSGVFDASVESLCKVKGISLHSATLIKLMPQLFSAYNIDKTKDITIVTSTDRAGRYFVPRFSGKSFEEVHVMLLDDKNKVLKCSKLFEGIENLTRIEIKKIVSFAILNNATKVIIAHNHPMGVAIPSKADYNTTKKLFEALELMNIELCDHIVVADDDFVSMVDSGFFAQFKY
ncbi:MAG: DNA repair protein RadC [Oscillospiraceae bacterium]|nr:DNA repair protein RadC [Oscillospiraceae bacterium]